MSAFCYCFHPDDKVCKVAGETCQTGESSQCNETLGNPGGWQLFSIFNVRTQWKEGGARTVEIRLEGERCEARKQKGEVSDGK